MSILLQCTVLGLMILSCLEHTTGARRVYTCSPPSINFPNGRIMITPTVTVLNQPVVQGTKVKYTCHRRFKLVGVRIRVCLRGGWSRRPPKCVAKNCRGKPGSIRHGKTFGSTRGNVGDYVRVFCDHGYELHGSKSIICQKNGKWSKKPNCLKKSPLRALKNVAEKLKEEFVDKLGLVTQDSKGRAGLSGGTAGLDLIFVLDNSRSVGELNFEKGKSFVKEMIKTFGVSRHPLGTRVAVIPFEEEAHLVVSLDDKTLNSTQAAMNKIDNEVVYKGGGTHTKTALLKVTNDVVPTSRKLSKKALFLITDGKSNKDQEPGDMAQLLRQKHEYEIFAIGISSGADKNELYTVASEPFRSHVFMLRNFDDLSLLAQLINGSKSDYSQCGIAGDTQSRLNASVARIVGGIAARPGAWPWQALILVDGNFRCSGVLLNDRWVLTAAHCFHKDQPGPGLLDVVLGEHDRSLEEGPEQPQFVSKIIPYPKNKRYGLDFDIALLKLEETLKLTAYVRPVCLPGLQDRALVLARRPGMITGWGSNLQVNEGQAFGPTQLILQQASVPFVHENDCERSSSAALPITENMICAGTGEGNVDACKGDSGGPLVARRSNDEWVLVGLVSWGEGCARRGKYGVYTRVSKFVDWISETMIRET